MGGQRTLTMSLNEGWSAGVATVAALVDFLGAAFLVAAALVVIFLSAALRGDILPLAARGLAVLVEGFLSAAGAGEAEGERSGAGDARGEGAGEDIC
jgi:hypothetical protein